MASARPLGSENGGVTEERRRPTIDELEAIERYRAQLNRRTYRPEELLERRRRHARLVAAMRDELARLAQQASDGN